MSSFTQIIYHIVFSTKNRSPVLKKENRERLYKYIWGIVKKHNCHLYRINGIEDHIHILTSVHPSVCLADLIKNIKLASSSWINTNGAFPVFDHWQEGYSAFTHSIKEKDVLIEYIKNQEEHHKKVSTRDELIKLFKDAGIEVDEKFVV